MSIHVEILHTLGCPGRRAAREAVERVAREEGIEVRTEERLVDSTEAARDLRFPGSPTVRVAGRDLEADRAAQPDYGLG